jgi:nicotinamide riboside kinase
MIKKIVVIGPESTGKSVLAEQLANHYGTVWCPEYAREYLLKNGKNYDYENLLTIAQGQIAAEELAVGSWQSAVGSQQPAIGNKQLAMESDNQSLTTHHSPFFIDTDMYVMKVWCEFVFGKCHRYILEQIVERKYDLYLLCNIDLPWVKDELREYPDLETRHKLYLIYKDIMINQSVPWVDISGEYDERLEKAIAAVDELIKVKNQK